MYAIQQTYDNRYFVSETDHVITTTKDKSYGKKYEDEKSASIICRHLNRMRLPNTYKVVTL